MKKKLLAVVAAGALTAATAVPALALENEFHGVFRVRGIMSNYDDAGSGPLTVKDNPGTKNYIEQRARLMYIAKANDDLKLVTHFEFDSRWGDNSYNSNNTTRNNGGGIGADQTNLETKNIYLDFNIPSTPVNMKVGIQGYNDNYKGIIFNNDAAGAVASARVGNATLGLAYFRFDDAVGTNFSSLAGTTTNSVAGYMTRDFLNVSGKYNITKDVKVGADYILLYSDVLRQSTDRTDIHMLGVNGEGKIGPVTLDGFFIYQVGHLGNPAIADKGQTVSAFAANVGAKAAVGPGTFRSNVLYISGENDPTRHDRNDFQTIMERSANTAGHAFYPGEMMILLRNKYATAGTDRAIAFDLNNGNHGIVGGFLGYDMTFGKIFSNTNLGMMAAAKDTTHEGKYMGTEINSELGYKLYDNMTASLQGAYVFLGDYFKGQNGAAAGDLPNSPFTARVQLQYVF
ncbi:alginate export family protein [Geobacter pickeringii]|uniref:Alginate export domain-containing protein n=1 Tax=Geobacter pickeringii TaxID=345632 RepID=A0A0B5BH34_9BACT|nr:alginate export family protein [Geobacter pickeringii]AJE04484.1 hypothetical protein GPICK_14940 [Geobacter pickeringii]